MPIDTSQLRFPKPTPSVIVRKAKRNAESREWRLTCARVDERDKRVCQITGRLLSAGASDPWCAIERHHLEPRSLNRSRRFNAKNVLTVSRAVHQLIHGGALMLLNRGGLPAVTVHTVNHVAWNRTIVPKGSEPCRLRKGLPVRKD